MDIQQSEGTRAQQILDVTWGLLKGAKLEALVYFVLLTALSSVLDLRDFYREEDSSTSFAITVAAVFLHYFLLVGIVRKNRMKTGSVNAGAVYFGIAFLSGLGTTLGLLLLIVPGIFLLARWAPAYGYALVEGAGVGESLKKSMDDTQGHTVAIAIASLIPVALYGAGLISLGLGYWEVVSFSEAALIAGNALIYAGSLLFTVMGIAVYSLLSRSLDPLTEVFE